MNRKRTFTELFNERPSVEELKHLKRLPIILILENIRSMHNVGSIFRSADALRLQALYLCGYTPAPPRKEIEKTALGATETVPWKKFDTSIKAAEEAQKKGFQLWVLEQTLESLSILDTKTDQPVALVLGNEVWGTSDEIIRIADKFVEIPQFGHKQSLNVSVAAGVALYALLKNISPKLWKP